MADGAPSLDYMESVYKAVKVQIGAMPQEQQEDVQTFCRSFRNQLAAGHVARIALMLVAAELSIAIARAKRDAAGGR